MARDRFSDLERVYDALKLAKVDINTLPANLDIRKYAEWKEGDAPDRSINKPSLGAPVDAGVIAFGLDYTDPNAKIQFTWNTRAKTFYDGRAEKALFGLELTTFTDYNVNGSFVPAKVTVANRIDNPGQAIPSGITGRKYKKRTGESRTIPLGQTATIKHFQAAVEGLLDSTLNDQHAISVKPEQWRRD